MLKFKLFERINRIPRKKLNDIYYHGYSVNENDNDLFTEFDTNYSDWNATWVTDNESIADEFSEQYETEKSIRVIYKVLVKTSGIAVIDNDTANNILDEWSIDDFRESIEILKNQGFKGWTTTGSIGRLIYDDIALFYPDEQTKILTAKLCINKKWTDYMPLNDAQKIVDKYYKKTS